MAPAENTKPNLKRHTEKYVGVPAAIDGRDVIRAIVSKTGANLPSAGYVAGGAVLSILLGRYWHGRYPIKDVDVFVPISTQKKSPSPVSSSIRRFGERGRIRLQGTPACSFGHANIVYSNSGSYRISSTKRDGILNSIECDGLSSAESLINGFDINCCQVAIDLSTGRLEGTEYFWAFLSDRNLNIINWNTPPHSLLRYVGKLKELGCKGDTELQYQRYLTLFAHLPRAGLLPPLKRVPRRHDMNANTGYEGEGLVRLYDYRGFLMTETSREKFAPILAAETSLVSKLEFREMRREEVPPRSGSEGWRTGKSPEVLYYLAPRIVQDKRNTTWIDESWWITSPLANENAAKAYISYLDGHGALFGYYEFRNVEVGLGMKFLTELRAGGRLFLSAVPDSAPHTAELLFSDWAAMTWFVVALKINALHLEIFATRIRVLRAGDKRKLLHFVGHQLASCLMTGRGFEDPWRETRDAAEAAKIGAEWEPVIRSLLRMAKSRRPAKQQGAMQVV